MTDEEELFDTVDQWRADGIDAVAAIDGVAQQFEAATGVSEFGFEAVNLIEVFPWCQRFASRSALCRCSSFPTTAASLAKIRKPRVKYQMF